ncbi:restriction endonuclease subunit S [Staphylococcus aureus]|uniref:restriction endonuclease subunit S n=1 Tax=Staphylococcus aureus TaxID=1280 RepID=UPI00288FECF3|nr:restriction endonuclease subunit S [Staphylococcus aureus]MDT3024205.1 restriction endonuclease subunit S [Staphylococcus aureus]
MSNTQTKNVPELKFPEFEGEWEEKKLGEFAGKVTKKNVDKKYIETLTNSAELGIISQKDYFDKEISNIDNIKKYYVVEENDFVYNPRISNYAPFGPVNRNKLGKKGVMSPLYTVFKIQNIDLNFIEFYFKSSKWYRFMALNGDSGARADRFSIKNRTFMEMPLHIPCMDEQIKIGQFFSKLDRQIELEEQKLELLQQQKKGYMQKIFSQELRFKDENGNVYPEWEERRFADIFKFHNKLRKPIKENLRVKGSYPYYGATGIIDYVDDFIFDGNYLLIGEDGANIITRSAPLVYLVNGKFWVNNHAHILSPLNGNIQYLYQVAELVNYEKYNTGTAQPKLNIQNLKIISVVISTNLEEQQKIGSFLSKLDRQIDLEEQKLELLQQRKKALLKSMFV